jgi:hypothetical protein
VNFMELPPDDRVIGTHPVTAALCN